MKRALLPDRPTLLVLLQRGWNILAGLVTVLLVTRWLSPVEQGYYFTFASLLALQIFFELGLNSVVVHLVAREGGVDTATAQSQARWRALADFLRRWYRVAAWLFVPVVVVIGLVFFSGLGELPAQRWMPAWLLLVGATAFNLYWSPFLAFAEGLGQMADVAALRLWQSLLGHALMWSALALGLGLWATPALALVTALCNWYWMRGAQAPTQYLRATPSAPATDLDWRRDILPMQWRIALSWIGGYLVFQSLTPLVFAQQGAREAGRLGLGLAIFSAVLALAMSWVNAAAPRLARTVALGQRRELNQLFRMLLRRSLAATVLACSGVLAAAWWLDALAHPLALRLPGLSALSLLALATMANCLIAAMAAYMRAHIEEPMLMPSLVGGVLTVLGAWVGAQHSLEAAVLAYAALAVLVGLPWTGQLFLTYYRRVPA